jgi:predicted Ser/Thr protein kinase
MNCPRCNTPTPDETLQEFGGVCPKCLLSFSEEKDAPAFPNLEIVGLLGQGGMGVVYKALQKNLNRTVALKVLSPHLSDDPEFLGRFTREAQALAQLSHPNIVAIHDSGVHDRVPYLVMEYVEGRSLRALLAAKELTAEQALKVVPQICDALQYAHSKGVVHRDIKPENILIDAEGRVKIADYGLAKIASIDQPRLTRSNFVMGTPHYMAPEQVENSSRVDHRADIYSLGVVFYEMLTGELPLGRFKAPSERAEVDRRLDPVVLKSLEREPGDRYQSAEEVKEHVTRLKNRAAPPRSRTGYVPPEPPGPLKKAAFVIANLGGLALGASIILSLLRAAALAELLGTIGIALLMASLVLWVFEVLRRGLKKALGGHVGWIAGIGFIVVMFGFSLLSEKSRHHGAFDAPAPPPQVEFGSGGIREDWSQDLPGSDPVLGLLSTEDSLYVVTPSEIREYTPATGQFWAAWGGTIEGVPLVFKNWMVVWGGGQIVLVQSKDFGLTETTRMEIPFKVPVAGAALYGGICYLQSTEGDVAAIGIETGNFLWKEKATPGLAVAPGVPPIVTDLDVVTIHDSGMELRDRRTGVHKNHSNTVQPGGKTIQWENGWGELHQKDVNVEFSMYFKSSLRFWWSMNTTTTPSVADCHMLLIKDLVVLTFVNQVFSVGRNAPFGDHWGGSTIPHTVGPPATVGDDHFAVPTVEGVLLFRAQDGHRLKAGIPGGLTLLAGWKYRVVGFDPKKRRLVGYLIR